MCKRILVVFLICVFMHTILLAEYVDIIHLKNGKKVKGIIIEQVLNKTVKIKTLENKIRIYNFAVVEKISKKKMKRITSDEISPETMMIYNQRKKSAGCAFAWSFFILPGAGHWYCGEVENGFVFFFLDVALIAGMYTLGISSTTESYESLWGSRETYTTTELNEAYYVFLGLLAISRLVEYVDCFYAAKRTNKKLREDLGVPESVYFSFSIKPNIQQNNICQGNIGLNCTF